MSIQLASPWLHQLKRVRPVSSLESNVQADVVVVGGGIAGVVTAYFILKETDRSVMLLERTRVAHGATGHNAGQLVDGFEKSFIDMVADFGLTLASEGIREVENAWTLFDEIVQNARLATPHSQFLGHSAYMNLEHIHKNFEVEVLREKGGLIPRKIYVAEEKLHDLHLKAEWKHLYEVIPHDNILTMLETSDRSYIVASSRRKGCMNSALFTEELVGYLLATYPSQFAVAEHAEVHAITLHKEHAILKVGTYEIQAKSVLLATNGFEKMNIANTAGADINEKFHYMVEGLIGYMAGFLEPIGKAPTAIEFHAAEKKAREVRGEDPYFYLTRRPFEMEQNEKHNLICVGGPEEGISDTTLYKKDQEFPVYAHSSITDFLKKTYAWFPKEDIRYAFTWHGLMGYTPNGIRVVGFEPRNPLLMYNLGCNGVGILTSIAGALRIAKLLRGDKLPASIFDPKKD